MEKAERDKKLKSLLGELANIKENLDFIAKNYSVDEHKLIIISIFEGIRDCFESDEFLYPILQSGVTAVKEDDVLTLTLVLVMLEMLVKEAKDEQNNRENQDGI